MHFISLPIRSYIFSDSQAVAPLPSDVFSCMQLSHPSKSSTI